MAEKLKIPKHWKYISLVEDLNYVPTGVEPYEGEKPYYSTGSIKDKEHIPEGIYSFSDRPSRANRLVQKNDVLQARMKGTNKALLIDDRLDGALFSTGFFQVRPYGNTYVPKFLYFYLGSSIFLKEKDALCSGSTQSALNDTNAKKIKIPLPPIEEQNRTVAKIESLFSELDKSIESLQTAKKKLALYRQSVLKAAFEGELTKAWREAHKDELEDADTLLERIKKEREEAYEKSLEEWKAAVKAWEESGKEGKKPAKPKKPKELPPLSEEELRDLPKLPDGWKWVKLQNISYLIQIGPFGSLLHKSDYIKNGIPIINPSHIKNQKIIPDSNLTISNEKAQSLKKYIMKKGDIVMGRRGEMGRCALISSKNDGFLCGTGSLFVRLSSMLNPKFYVNILGSKNVRDFLENCSIGTTMQNLNEKILQTVPVPVMSIKEQNEIIHRINTHLDKADEVEETIDKNLQKAKMLRQSILKQAFEGKLVQADIR